jgi:hypothetical protein
MSVVVRLSKGVRGKIRFLNDLAAGPDRSVNLEHIPPPSPIPSIFGAQRVRRKFAGNLRSQRAYE